MNRFYLNECLGGGFACQDLADALEKVVLAFASLAKKPNMHVDKGWTLEKEPKKTVLGGKKLLDIVQCLQNREIKRLFYSYTLNYPVEDFFKATNVDELLEANYGFENEDATNMVIVGKNHGTLLTLPVTDALRQDWLTARSDNQGFEDVQVLNLHGYNPENATAVENELLKRNYDKAPCDISKLEFLAPHVVMPDSFKKRFEIAPLEHKKYIFERIDEVLNNNLLQPLRCNGTMIKHVAEHVAELRIVNPVDIRVYFHEDGDTLYFAKMALKSEYVSKNAQDKDIEKAEEIIQKLMKQ